MCFFFVKASSKRATLGPAGLFRGYGLLVCGINMWWGIFVWGWGSIGVGWAIALMSNFGHFLTGFGEV